MNVRFAGRQVALKDQALAVGDRFPDAVLVAGDLSDKKVSDFEGKRLILTFPSVDTPVCAVELAKFNQEVAKLDGVTTLAVSMDLPFAQARWCQAKSVENLVPLSDYRDGDFSRKTGIYLEGVGLTTRAVFVVDAAGETRYVEYVSDVGEEPDYAAALEALKSLD